MELLLILVLLLTNGVLAMSETAMVSSQKIRLRQRAAEGSAGAAAALQLAERPTRFLSTVQVGITLMSILLGAVGEAAVATDVRRILEGIPAVAPFAQPASLVIIVVGFTLASVVLGELVPKRLALMAPEAVASAGAIPMQFLSRIAAPVVGLLSFLTDLILLPLRGRVDTSATVTSQEINLMVSEGAAAGEFTPEEQRMVERVLHLGDQRVGQLMVHRTEMTWLDVATPLDRARRVARSSGLLHFPLCKGTVDRIVGVVDLRDLLPTDSAATDLKAVAKPPVFVPESAPVLRVLERCRAAAADVAFVVDEYGAVQGEVSVARILDQLVGRVFSAAEPTGVIPVRAGSGTSAAGGPSGPGPGAAQPPRGS
ncbi:MAG: hemolysin family protein [Planctomycetota bacterium]|nr:hemolysin family protein [Planctomycetota bacterium]